LFGFERATTQGSAIAAYNAALMHLELGADDGRDAALALIDPRSGIGSCQVSRATPQPLASSGLDESKLEPHVSAIAE